MNTPQGAAKAVLGWTTFWWIASIIFGLLLHTDLTKEELKSVRQTIPFLRFDQLLRTYGAALPALPFILRWFAAALSRPSKTVTPPRQFAEAVVLYTVLTAGRFFIYGLHVTGVLHAVPALLGALVSFDKGEEGHLMSDHLLLGASMTAILAAEIAFSLEDLKRAFQSECQDSFRLLFVGAALLLSGLICMSTIVDMFYTARYFHGPKEVFGALLPGYILFQGPAQYWVLGRSWEQPRLLQQSRNLAE